MSDLPDLNLKVGDTVEAWGVEGTVVRVQSIGYDEHRINVEFPSVGRSDEFMSDGREYIWHRTPSLKVIKRAKEKQILREYVSCDEDGVYTSIWVDDKAFHLKRDRLTGRTIEVEV